jgi:cytochrome c biogenesis protein CcmG/thiol:disulfide interchange protein DsbE
MKNFFVGIWVFLFFGGVVSAQNGLPNVTLTSLDGQHVQTGEISNDGKPIVISFWATWCSPCKRELNNIHDVYDEWVEETGVKLIAVSIDDARQVYKVAPYVNGRGWEFDVLLDPNGDFKRAMNVNNVPFTLLLTGDGEIVYEHNNYVEGDEEELYDLILELVN